jgi:oxygen-independent coproporphyrinogen-3 oxidase
MRTASLPSAALLAKYNVPVPRYTSYPTVPYWQDEAPAQHAWAARVRRAFRNCPEVSLYVHLPYCEQLCTYCGCNTRITRQHAVEGPYVDALLREWDLYRAQFGQPPVVRELHLGGGTPTFFSPENLERLVAGLLEGCQVPRDREYSFEAHPSSTTREHLEALWRVGFTRVSIGVQDFGADVLAVINRHQTEAQVRQVVAWAREIGYDSVNFDLIFGLPLQTPAHIDANLARLAELRPDRIAFYSYAHVPWVKPGQRAYSEADLPSEGRKRALYEQGREGLEALGYREIGMDHFALPHDALCRAAEDGTLHRNFMGYTPAHTELLVGLGASAIGDSLTAFVQNEKRVEDYLARVARGEFPFYRGHLLDAEDLVLRRHIGALMCQGRTEWASDWAACGALREGVARLQDLADDGLVEADAQGARVTALGQPFLRNICTALDARLWRRQPQTQLFSQAV